MFLMILPDLIFCLGFLHHFYLCIFFRIPTPFCSILLFSIYVPCQSSHCSSCLGLTVLVLHCIPYHVYIVLHATLVHREGIRRKKSTNLQPSEPPLWEPLWNHPLILCLTRQRYRDKTTSNKVSLKGDPIIDKID